MKIALYQMCSKLDYQENLSKVSEAAKSAAEQGAKYLFLPECFYSMSDGRSPSPHLVSEKNEHFTNISQISKENEVYLLGGSVAYKEGDKVLNRSLNFSPSGELIGSYDKIHLFNCDLVKKSVNEADIYTPGKEPLLLNIDGHKVGINICFDLRFPEMGRQYARAGAEILTYASAFTVPTGKAHWHTLVKAVPLRTNALLLRPRKQVSIMRE